MIELGQRGDHARIRPKYLLQRPLVARQSEAFGGLHAAVIKPLEHARLPSRRNRPAENALAYHVLVVTIADCELVAIWALDRVILGGRVEIIQPRPPELQPGRPFERDLVIEGLKGNAPARRQREARPDEPRRKGQRAQEVGFARPVRTKHCDNLRGTLGRFSPTVGQAVAVSRCVRRNPQIEDLRVANRVEVLDLHLEEHCRFSVFTSRLYSV